VVQHAESVFVGAELDLDIRFKKNTAILAALDFENGCRHALKPALSCHIDPPGQRRHYY
jgi:hypothetical protein